MKRREFLSAGCACGASLITSAAFAQSAWQTPARFARPDLASDEGGLWSLMDREETGMRRSPFAIRDPELRDYIQSIACRLAGEHCPDVRVHLMQTPHFNASMAPNGMMQIWTGLMLRVENEAQLAAVIGHEIGHYLMRHTLDRMRDIKARAAFSNFLGLLGVAGAIGQLAVLASAFGYTRDQEREADRVGLALMHKAGYDTAEAAKVWTNLMLEIKARPGGDPGRFPLFASHPSPEERQETMRQLAAEMTGGERFEERWNEKTKPHLREWLLDEIKRGQHEESIALFTRMIVRFPARADFAYARGEVYRMRAQANDFEAALADYQAAVQRGGEPPQTHRGLGFIYRQRQQQAAAQASFERYLEAEPKAPDAPMIRNYLQELRT